MNPFLPGLKARASREREPQGAGRTPVGTFTGPAVRTGDGTASARSVCRAPGTPAAGVERRLASGGAAAFATRKSPG
ncbi:hypothetical protein ABZ883_29915 [Streptomyces sp. NPDC046977]|uniref:hypothetical protein n=1 Tax=Streptomyces sp. NPDC046977 TaxID=3154703 RepID=UPI0033D8DD7A